MTVRLYAMTCGWLTMPMEMFLDGEEGEIRLPVPWYLIDHPKGQALFDSGLHADLQDPVDRRAQIITKHFRPEFLNRIDDIIVFNSLDKNHLHKIIDLQLRDLKSNLTQKNNSKTILK